MKSSLFVVLGLLLVDGLPVGALGQPVVEAQLEVVGTNIVSVGKIPCYEIKTVPFRLKNRSTTPVSIRRLKSTCVCVRAEKDKWRVMPGEEAVVTLNIDPMEISGPFQRGAWVITSDHNQSQLKLMVDGESIPLFKGQPTTMLSFHAPKLGVVWTNCFPLAATEAGLRLGRPVFGTNENLRVALTLTTNLAEKITYQATLVVTPLTLGRHVTSISLPVEGKEGMPPVTINLLTRSGLELSVAPDQLLLTPSETPVTRRFLLSTQEDEAKPKELTWTPQDEGLTVQAKTSTRTANLMIEVTLSPAAITRLLAKKNATLVFNYPNYEPASVRLFSTDGENQGKEEDLSDGNPLTRRSLAQHRLHGQLFNPSQNRLTPAAPTVIAR